MSHQNSIQDEIKCRLKVGSPNTFVFSTSLQLNIEIYKTITMPVVLYGLEAWSFTLSEKCMLRVFENWI
jgi:hypothetical protein